MGARYYQEIAPGSALDRAEVTDLSASVGVSWGDFDGCLETVETTPLEPGAESVKYYCPGIGIVYDDGLELIEYRQGSLSGSGQAAGDSSPDSHCHRQIQPTVSLNSGTVSSFRFACQPSREPDPR